MGNVSGKPRARDLGLPFEGVTGEYNAITDVPADTDGRYDDFTAWQKKKTQPHLGRTFQS